MRARGREHPLQPSGKSRPYAMALSRDSRPVPSARFVRQRPADRKKAWPVSLPGAGSLSIPQRPGLAVSFSRTQRSAWALASSLLFSVVTMLIGFVSTPWLLRWLGSERLGMHRVLLGSFTYFGFLALGVDGALLAHLANEIGRGERNRVARLLAAGFRAYLPVTFVIVVAGLVYSLCIPHIFVLGSLSTAEVVVGAVVMTGNLLWTPLTVFRALADAEQRGYLVKNLLTLQSILLTGCFLAAARTGWGLPGQSLALVIAQAPTLTILAMRGLRAYPELRSVRVRPEDRAALWSLSWPTLAVVLGGQVALQSDSIVVGAFLGPGAVTAFFLTQRLASLALAQLQSLGSATWAPLV